MWGKIFLGGVGAVLGGPIGAGIGAAIGHKLFDSSEQSIQTSNSSSSDELFDEDTITDEDTIAIAHFVCFFATLAKLAKADGRVTKDEIMAIESLMAEMNLDSETRNLAIEIFKEAKDNDTHISEYLEQFAALTQYDQDRATFLMLSLCSVAAADGDVSVQEREMLRVAEQSLRLKSGTTDMYLGKEMSLQEAYNLLECTANMTDSEVKRLYRKKCMDFHPDRLASQGLPPEFTKFANEQMVKVHEAYEVICRMRSCEYVK
ncbi:TerB family tellurite resistance protein [Chroococcus sp. FPU101]|uniref:TerB family tellurite resistance protein n=1 Tax=Chroococcus sp. FPU101 TaxID=1974212 RepID=UPI001A8DF7D0|nr:TerB family tellurite resistance protein [Chroococcus sp. FPU101]GFE71885.1 co-chaperone protein DjlA [Chroococcus sp. FPU101]